MGAGKKMIEKRKESKSEDGENWSLQSVCIIEYKIVFKKFGKIFEKSDEIEGKGSLKSL